MDDGKNQHSALGARARLLLGIALGTGLSGCSAGGYSHRADRQARGILERRTEEVLGSREETAREPEPPPAPEPAPEAGDLENETAVDEALRTTEVEARTVSLQESLAIAYRGSRRMMDQRELLHIQALSLSSVRHGFSPQLDLVLGYLFTDSSTPGDDFNTGSADFSVSQILPTGGTLSLGAATGADAFEGQGPGYDSFLSLTLAQPLLRGGGYAVSHEPLVQAERTLVYAVRNFELFREDFSIDVARRFYDLVNRKQTIGNQVTNLESNQFSRRQSEALFAVGRASELDVLRARRSELTARNALLEAQESLQLALDNFRIFLGLPDDQPIDVLPDSPAFTPVSYDLRSAIEVAMENRLDLMNRREQVEDVERGVLIARNGLLPDLNLTASTSYGTGVSGTLFGDDLDRNDTSVGLTLGIPLDRVRERNAYRTTEIGLTRARRDLEEFEDQLRVSIKSSFRELERRLESLDIQRQLIVDQTKNLRIAELRFERGEIPNRDVVEANQSLLDAQNNLIDEQVSYEIARLQLLRDLGILFVDDDGMWK